MKTWKFDLNIRSVDSDLTDAELNHYYRELKETVDVKKNLVYFSETGLFICADEFTDARRFVELLNELCDKGCVVEVYSEDADGNADLHEMTGDEWDALEALTAKK